MTITREKTIVIIGAGVIGLSSALCLQTAGYRVAVIAQDFPEPIDFAAPDPAERRINYASQWAGAHNRWVPATTSWEQRDHDFALATFAHMRRVVAADATSPNPRSSLASPEAGVAFLKAEEYLEVPRPEYLALTEARARELGMQGFRLLSRAEMPPDVVWACEYDTWCVNPMVYLAYLARRLALGGCLFLKKQLQELDDAFKPNPLIGPILAVVNCSGWGFADPDVFPIRGQTAVVSNQCSKTITRQRKDGSWTFCIPRGLSGGTIIGGTKQPNDMKPHVCPDTRAGLLRAFTETNRSFVASDMAQTGPLHWVRDIVGRRPARHGGMRLEPEVLTPGKIVVHAYGLGGRGYELSWGVAEAVAKLVEKAVATGEGRGERAKL